MKIGVRILLYFLIIFAGTGISQNIILQPAKGYNSGTSTPSIRLFFARTDSVVLEWSSAVSSASFKIGTSTGNYNLGILSAGSGVRKSFIPGNAPLNLSTGRYFGLITNSDKTTSAEIQAQAQANPSIKYSNEVQFVIESPTAPNPSAPRGNVTTSTPVFQWAAIPGVPAYWIIVSSTPFVVRSDTNQVTHAVSFSVQGANVTWDYLSSTNSATYGVVSPYSPFTQTAIPLFAGNSYYYTILNLYDATDVTYASSVFGGVVSFTYQSATTISAPNLVTPADNQIFNGDQAIRFQWDAVGGANNYSIYLFNRITQLAGSSQEIDVPIWNGTTTNTIFDFPARQNLTKGKYVWFVVPNTSTGAGVSSARRLFQYSLPLSKFTVSLKSTTDNSALTNFSVSPVSTTGGYAPSVPYIITNSQTLTDSLPSDVYQFTVKKQGYFDSTMTFTLTGASTVNVAMYAKPYPSTVSGKVVNQANAPLQSANIQFVNVLTNQNINTATSSSGEFSINIAQGTYRITASLPGYLSPASRTVSVGSGQLVLDPSFQLTADLATISGKAINDAGAPVQLAIVKASKAGVVQEKTTNATGDFSFELSSGTWTLEASKTGFISPTPQNINLATGSNLQNQNISLVPRANQVSGFVYRAVVSGTTTSTVPASGVTVTATPTSGSAVTAVTSTNGQFQLSLKSGTWTITAQLSGYTSSNSPQVTLTVGQTVSGVDFTLNPNPSSVSGTVTETGGAVLGNVTVTNGTVNTVTLTSGTYQLSLPAGAHTVSISKQGYSASQPVSITLTPGQNLSGINFTMNPNAGVISGTVKSLGQPLTGAVVTAAQTGRQVTATTNEQGIFSVSVPAGSWNVSAAKSGFLTSTGEAVAVGAGQSSENHNYELIENIATIKGVMTSTGNALNGVSVLIRNKTNPSSSFNTLTNVTGEFSVSVPAGAEYTLNATLIGYSSFNSNIPLLNPRAVQNINGNLSPVPAQISGTVLNTQLQPVGNAKIYLINTSSSLVVDSTTTAVSGAYTIGSLAGAMRVKAVYPGYLSDSLNLTVVGGQSLSNVNMKVTPNFALISGTVKDAGGNTLGGAFVSVTAPMGGGSDNSANNGAYSITLLGGDLFTVTITKTGYGTFTQTNYQINPGETKILNVTLAQLTGSISGQTRDQGNNAVGGVSVDAENAAGQDFSTTSDASGNYSITGLALGTYIVSASKSGYTSTQTISVNLTAGSTSGTATINDLKQNTAKVTGVISDVSNTPISGVQILLKGAGGTANAVTNFSGSFEIANLADGTYNLTATKQGYIADSSSFLVTGTITKNIKLNAAITRIYGKVTDHTTAANPLIFSAAVKAIFGQSSVTTYTDAQGNFSFENLSSNLQYVVVTDIFREGNVNDDTVFTVPAGASQYGPLRLIVKVSRSQISGNAGTGNATLLIRNTATNESFTKVSGSAGTFQFDYLSDGNYTLKPTKTGYIFTPDSVSLTISIRDTISRSFTARENVGAVSVSVKDNLGNNINDAAITAISTDNQFVFTGRTSSAGTVLLSSVVANKSYTLTAEKSGYTASPQQKTISVPLAGTVTESFTLTPNTSSINGVVRNPGGTGIPDAAVVYRNLATGSTNTQKTASNGQFVLSSLSAGDCIVFTTISGYRSDTVRISLGTGETRSNQIVTATPTFVALNGRVTYGGSGLANVDVKATASGVFTSKSDDNGYIRFNALPINMQPGSVTDYIITISGADFQSQSKTISIPQSAVGTPVTLPEFVLPSGKITAIITDGNNPMSGVTLTFVRPDGNQTSIVTDNTGKYETQAKLSAGTYKVSVAKEQYLTPDDNLLKFVLANDNSTITRNVPLRYSHIPVPTMDASTKTVIELKAANLPGGTTAALYYRQGTGGDYIKVHMTQGTGKFTGEIPILNNTADVTYYLTAAETNPVVNYTSSAVTVTPEATGVLSSVEFTPSVDNTTIRANDSYEIKLIVRDGKNNVLTDSVRGTATGSVTWEVSNENVVKISYPKPNDNTDILLKVTQTGNYSITATVKYKGNIIRQTAQLIVKDVPLKNVVVNSPVIEMSNRSNGVQFSYSGIDTSSSLVVLGNSLTWSVAPKEAGTIDSTGFFKPSDATFIGSIAVIATDQIQKKSGSNHLSIYAPIDSSSNITLTDKKGMTIAFTPNLVSFPIKVTLADPQFGPGKKYYTPIGKQISYVVSNNQYFLSYSGDRALPGNSLSAPATMTLPVDNSISLFESDKFIGYYDPESNEWSLVTPASTSTQITTGVTTFGEYSVLAENLPLGISDVAVLPDPFSPMVAPLKIGYRLNSLQPPASITIKIYNMRGELVRALLQNDLQMPGLYGSADRGIKSIVWDGKTDNGNDALNGRYLIRITAKDPSGETSTLTPVVLIK